MLQARASTKPEKCSAIAYSADHSFTVTVDALRRAFCNQKNSKRLIILLVAHEQAVCEVCPAGKYLDEEVRRKAGGAHVATCAPCPENEESRAGSWSKTRPQRCALPSAPLALHPACCQSPPVVHLALPGKYPSRHAAKFRAKIGRDHSHLLASARQAVRLQAKLRSRPGWIMRQAVFAV
jgi:hypothetical protein